MKLVPAMPEPEMLQNEVFLASKCLGGNREAKSTYMAQFIKTYMTLRSLILLSNPSAHAPISAHWHHENPRNVWHGIA